MTTEEFSNGFDTLVSSYRRFKDFDKQESLDSLEFDEYEKSLWLTKAQEEIVINFYAGRNSYGFSFETTEELRRYLESLVKSKQYGANEAEDDTSKTGHHLNESSLFFALEPDIAYIIHEHIKFSDSSLGCYNERYANVYPTTHDEYNRIIRNPFRGPNKYKALRIDSGNGYVEIISKYQFSNYDQRYLSKPTPIILENLPNGVTIDGEYQKTECALNSLIHNTILNRAVQMALASKGIKVNS